MHTRFQTGIHQYFVNQDQGRATKLLRAFQQLHQQGLGRRRIALLIFVVWMEQAESLRAGELEGQNAPRMQKSAGFATGSADIFQAPFHIDLVEAQRDDMRTREVATDMFPKLPDGRKIRQRIRIPEQVVESD